MKTAELRMIPVDQLKPAEYNPRKKLKPGDAEYEKIKHYRVDKMLNMASPIPWWSTRT